MINFGVTRIQYIFNKNYFSINILILILYIKYNCLGVFDPSNTESKLTPQL